MREIPNFLVRAVAATATVVVNARTYYFVLKTVHAPSLTVLLSSLTLVCTVGYESVTPRTPLCLFSFPFFSFLMLCGRMPIAWWVGCFVLSFVCGPSPPRRDGKGRKGGKWCCLIIPKRKTPSACACVRFLFVVTNGLDWTGLGLDGDGGRCRFFPLLLPTCNLEPQRQQQQCGLV